jgi:hypothetical protein
MPRGGSAVRKTDGLPVAIGVPLELTTWAQKNADEVCATSVVTVPLPPVPTCVLVHSPTTARDGSGPTLKTLR